MPTETDTLDGMIVTSSEIEDTIDLIRKYLTSAKSYGDRVELAIDKEMLSGKVNIKINISPRKY